VLTLRHRVWMHLGISLLLGIGLVWGSPLAQAADPLPLPAGLTAPSQPTRLPTFSLPDVQGTTVQETALHGKVVIVRFWASW
jgi:cytochrome oxidase Cu insertion factor (SCO1/SenC/PrrC family)